MHQTYIRENVELREKSEMGREKTSLKCCFQWSGSRCVVVLYQVDGAIGSQPVIWSKIDNNLHKNIQVADRDEVICFEESFHLKKKRHWSFMRGKEDTVLAKETN